MLAAKNTKKAKVKTGCRTCKIRKVKCDEGKPACHRCISTGRVCDGYGIWGGGGNRYGNQHAPQRHIGQGTLFLPHRELAPHGVISGRQHLCFEWFVSCTAQKMPGTFSSTFWHSLVVQASSTEPAVLHAAVALSSTHQQIPYRQLQSAKKRLPVPDEEERFMLHQYSEAINHLRMHSSSTPATVRTTLIACLLFICIDLFRCKYRSAILHLESGLKLLQDYSVGRTDRNGSLTNFPEDFVEFGITEAFCRLHVSSVLLGQISSDLYPGSPIGSFHSRTFSSVNQARHSLDQLLIGITYLAEKARHLETSRCSSSDAELVGTQRQLQSSLSLWKQCHMILKNNNKNCETIRDSICYGILEQYHTMAEIMADTCLEQANESIFDSHIHRFTLIVERSIPQFKFALSTALEGVLPGHGANVSKSIYDLGCIPLLYYVAVKCRSHQVRLYALKLLKLLSHSEGVWHASIAMCVAEEIIRIEEGAFYRSFGLDDNFCPYTLPVKNQSLPVLPESQRIRHVQVILPGDNSENLVIIFDRESNGKLETMEREYNVSSQTWNAT